MKKVRLERMTGDGKCTPGAVYVDGNFICFSVENTEKLYPAGNYTMRLGMTGRTMPDRFEGQAYEVMNVPGRTLIKWHVANAPDELEGCTAPNTNLYGGTLVTTGGASKRATEDFMIAMEGVGEAELEVVECSVS